jgi:hypothetical protein
MPSESEPAPAPSDRYNVYDQLDTHFINYAELYKTPKDLSRPTPELIRDYANALVTGTDNSRVYPDSPNLVGNRYFLNTGTLCANKDNPSDLHPRSVLVDSVLSSTMNIAVDKNQGLMYSLLASIKNLNSDEMFNNMDNNQPTADKKYSPTGYLSNITNMSVPLCSNVGVYSDDKEESDNVIYGWVTENDRKTIDPLSVKEGFGNKEGWVDAGDYVGGAANFREFAKGADQLKVAGDQQTVAMESQMNKTMNDAQVAAEKVAKKGRDSAAAQKSANFAANKSRVAKGQSSGKKLAQESRNAGLLPALRQQTLEYLNATTDKSTIELFNTLINMTYVCGETNTKIRVSDKCIMGIYDTKPIADVPSEDSRRSDLCKGTVIPANISIKQLFASISDLLRTKRNDTTTKLDITKDLQGYRFPSNEICIIEKYPIYYQIMGVNSSIVDRYGYRNKNIPSADYPKLLSVLNGASSNDENSYRYLIARAIIQLTYVNTYGTCPNPALEPKISPPPPPPPAPVTPVTPPPTNVTNTKSSQDTASENDKRKQNSQAAASLLRSLTGGEGFTTYVTDGNIVPSFSDVATWFYLISLLFIALYMLYKFADRLIDFEMKLL